MGGEGRLRHAAGGALREGKLRPTTVQSVDVPARLGQLVRPRFGSLTLVHAGAGYGKTTALAATHQPDWVWYNLDASDRRPGAFVAGLSRALMVDAPVDEESAGGEALALELADRLHGRAATMTLDRYEQVGDLPEFGRFLSELLTVAPALALRVGTRSRPSLPLERLRLEGRLVEAGPGEMRLERTEIAQLLTRLWGRPPQPAELDFADRVLEGWPAALRLWHPAVAEGGDLLAPLQPGQPLYEYLQEEVVRSMPAQTLQHVCRDWRWMLGRGPLVKRATNGGRREVADRLVRDRIGVVPRRNGWHLHPLLVAFANVRAPRRGGGTLSELPEPVDAGDRPPDLDAAPRVEIRTFGGLEVIVDGSQVPDARLPSAARRLLELLLSTPGCEATAREAASRLWPHHPPRAALNSFNVALHGLRRVLEPELTAGAKSRYVVREKDRYRLGLERLTCDAEEFVHLVGGVRQPLDEAGAGRLQAAVDLQRAPFLDTCVETFAEARREELGSMLRDSLELLGHWYAGAGCTGLAVRAFKQLAGLDPGRQDLWSRLLDLDPGGEGALLEEGIGG